MSSTAPASATTENLVWARYADIVRVLNARYQLDTNWIQHSKICMAIQRLGQIILLQQDLDPRNYPVLSKFSLNTRCVIELYTTEDMLTTQIAQWEAEQPSLQAGHDVFTEGHPAGFRFSPSLQETLDQPYAQIKAMVDTTLEQKKEIFRSLEEDVNVELSRLKKNGSTEKIKEINASLDHLRNAFEPHASYIGEATQTPFINIYSRETMLDAKLGKYSLLEALNLSTNSIASMIFGLQPSWWGNATAASNVVNKLTKG